jgi:outer membrane scaffolding protein for murein synthesis (MipA/OmpV family)
VRPHDSWSPTASWELRSPNWTIGAGIVYSRLADEAGQSPIVSDRGSRDQWVAGAGAMYIW